MCLRNDTIGCAQFGFNCDTITTDGLCIRGMRNFLFIWARALRPLSTPLITPLEPGNHDLIGGRCLPGPGSSCIFIYDNKLCGFELELMHETTSKQLGASHVSNFWVSSRFFSIKRHCFLETDSRTWSYRKSTYDRSPFVLTKIYPLYAEHDRVVYADLW
jgi:hypothetical protein